MNRRFPLGVCRRTGGILAVAFFWATVVAPGWVSAGWQDTLFKLLEKAPAANSTLSEREISEGLRDALRVGTRRVVDRLGRNDGFLSDPAVHIPLPDKFKTVQQALSKIGMAGMLDDLELRLNRAAELAAPAAGDLFLDTIAGMTITDAVNIYNGPEDAATRYFQDKMTIPLGDAFRPIVDQSLAEAGAIQTYERVMGQYRSLPFVPDVKSDLTAHVVDYGLSGIFHYLAREEAAIRQDPGKRTTEILKKVFGRSAP